MVQKDKSSPQWHDNWAHHSPHMDEWPLCARSGVHYPYQLWLGFVPALIFLQNQNLCTLESSLQKVLWTRLFINQGPLCVVYVWVGRLWNHQNNPAAMNWPAWKQKCQSSNFWSWSLRQKNPDVCAKNVRLRLSLQSVETGHYTVYRRSTNYWTSHRPGKRLCMHVREIGEGVCVFV